MNSRPISLPVIWSPLSKCQRSASYLAYSKKDAFLPTLSSTPKESPLFLFLSSQFSSVAQSCPTLCDPMNRSTPGLPVHHQLLEFTQTHVHRVHDANQHLILGRALFLLPPISPSIRVFSNESTLHVTWPKYWSFSFSISPSKEIPGLSSFRMDWLDLLAVLGTLRSLFQHLSSKASILRLSAFFTVQLSHDLIKQSINNISFSYFHLLFSMYEHVHAL